MLLNNLIVIFFDSLPTVWGNVSWVCKVSSQPGGGWDILWTDCVMGQPEQQAHSSPENSAVCSRTHSNALTHTMICLICSVKFLFLCSTSHCIACSTRSTVWTWWAPRMLTTWSVFPLTARCAPGALICFLSLRCSTLVLKQHHFVF